MTHSQGPPPPFNLDTLKQQIESLLLSWGAPGLGLGLVIHYARTGQWLTAALALVGTGGVILLLKFFSKLDARLDALAEWSVGQTERSLLILWWNLTSQFQGKYYQQLIYALRDYRVQGLKTKGPFVLDLRRVFVPLNIAPESADRVTAAMVQTAKTEHGLDLWDVLVATTQQPAFRRLVILGAPGSGKSTLLEHLTLTYAQSLQRRQHRRVPPLVPVLFYLREVADAIAHDPPPTLVTLIQEVLTHRRIPPPPQWFERRLQQGRCLIMLDGLDEIADTSQRQQVSQWITAQMQVYPATQFIVTSRPFGYKTAPLEQGIILEVLPFNLAKMQTFLQNWYLQNEIMSRLGKNDPGVRAEAQRQADDLIRRITCNAALAAMALNPLLLTMIATVHRYRGALPGRRVELYAEMCDVLLGRRQDAKGLVPDKLTAAQKQTVLQTLALNRMRKRSRDFTLLQGSLLIQEKLVAVAGRDLYPVDFLQQVERVSGLLVEKQPGVYEFAHKSIQEYLAAVQVKESNLELLLTRNIDNPWWEETIRLYAAQTDASNVIWAAIQKNTVSALTLAYECVQEGLIVQRDVRRELEETLDWGVRSPDPALFRLAVEVKLSRRFRQFIRLDELTELDMEPITQVEFQLFLDDLGREAIAYRPPTWTDPRHTPGIGHTPIRGISEAAATAFCEWLTTWTSLPGDTFLEGGDPIFVGEFRYRRATIEEQTLLDKQASINEDALRLVRERNKPQGV